MAYERSQALASISRLPPCCFAALAPVLVLGVAGCSRGGCSSAAGAVPCHRDRFGVSPCSRQRGSELQDERRQFSTAQRRGLSSGLQQKQPSASPFPGPSQARLQTAAAGAFAPLPFAFARWSFACAALLGPVNPVPELERSAASGGSMRASPRYRVPGF